MLPRKIIMIMITIEKNEKSIKKYKVLHTVDKCMLQVLLKRFDYCSQLISFYFYKVINYKKRYIYRKIYYILLPEP